jgi:hypothetical protein
MKNYFTPLENSKNETFQAIGLHCFATELIGWKNPLPSCKRVLDFGIGRGQERRRSNGIAQ